MKKIWVPWLMDSNGNRLSRVILGRDFHSIGEINSWFNTLPITNPRLVGKHIEFEEVEDTRPVSISVPRPRDT